MKSTQRKTGNRPMFQCSSASRKFLNFVSDRRDFPDYGVSVLFSEPKIPQFGSDLRGVHQTSGVSVLFSEPKIPQSFARRPLLAPKRVFQCSSASRKFLNRSDVRAQPFHPRGFSALQRAENSSMSTLAPASIHISDRDDHASSFLSLPGASP